LPGDVGSAALGINASGQVAGVSAGPNGESHAFLYAGGPLTNLGALPGDDNSQANAINTAGKAAGYSWNGLTPDHPHAVIYADGSVTDLGTLDAGSACNYSYARAINDSDEVVGVSAPASISLDCVLNQEAFLYASGVMTDLGHLPGDVGSEVHGINNLGQAVGGSWFCASVTGDCAYHAVLFSGGTVTDLGSLPGGAGHSEAFAINDAGDITGISGGDVFLYRNGVMTDLGNLPQGPMVPFAMNSAEHIVGGLPGGGGDTIPTAFYWSLSTGMLDMNSFVGKKMGWQIGVAFGINDNDQVVGGGSYNGQGRAFLLTVPKKYTR
jgi:probable HAF family extracellular repeat protein